MYYTYVLRSPEDGDVWVASGTDLPCSDCSEGVDEPRMDLVAFFEFSSERRALDFEAYLSSVAGRMLMRQWGVNSFVAMRRAA